MNEKFNFNRFWTYFKYDLKQMWRNHSKAAIVIGGSIAFLYVIWVLFSLVFAQKWQTPSIEARFALLTIAFTVLEFYQTRTYGYLTEKKAGSAWLMIPASRTEKFVSMLLMTLIVIPIFFFAVYFCIDGVLSLVDPTYGKALITGAADTYKESIYALASFSGESPITFTPGAITFMGIFGFFCNFLYFLLCGICFKKNKIVGAIGILFGLSVVLSILTGLIVPQFANSFTDVNLSDDQAARLLVGFLNASEVLICLLAVGLGWGVWRRIKTIQH